MKKTVKILSLFLVLVVLLVGCNEVEYLVNVDYEDFNTKLENKEDFILEVVQTGCSNCTAFSPKFENVLEEYEITAYSLNLTDMTESDRKNFLDTYKVDGTPTVIFFKKGKETSTLKRITGNQNKEKIKSKLEANGYIEE